MGEFTKKISVAGINFKSANLQVRGPFALSNDRISDFYTQCLRENDGNSFFILSTCNRTEIYSATHNEQELLKIFSKLSGESVDKIEKISFIKRGEEAINHLFRVSSGLDSQIIGDYEIVGQLKAAFGLAKKHGVANGVMEKLVNISLQSSKTIKNQTSLSNGTTSVSYAVVKLLKQLSEKSEPLKICIMGLGKIGTTTLKNIQDNLPQHHITVINRTEEHAEIIAEKFRVGYTPFTCKRHLLNESDVLVVATSAEQPFVRYEDVVNTPIRYVFDLSVPCNVEDKIREISRVKLFNIDELSQIINETLETRKNDIPTAEKIISKHIAEFRYWEMKRKVFGEQNSKKPVIEVAQSKLEDVAESLKIPSVDLVSLECPMLKYAKI